MDAHIEARVSQAVFAASLIERALHSKGVWEMRCGDIVVPVERDLSTGSIVFRGHFPEHCWIVRPAPLVLMEDGVERLVRECEPSDAGFQVNWGLDVLVPA